MNIELNKFPIGLVESKTSPVRSALLTKSELKEKFSKPRTGVKDGPGYVPAKIPSGKRLASLVESISMIIFDIDNKSEAISEADILNNMKSHNFEGILHSTYSHTHDQPRFRLILFITAPIEALSYKTAIYQMANILGITASMDSACTDPARLFYFPRCPEERLKDYVYHYFDGSPVDVDSCLNNVERGSNLIPVPAFFQRQENQDTWPEREEHIAKVKDFLSYCPADCDYQIWRDICWAVCWLNWDCGEDLIRQWSQQSKHYWSDENAFQAEAELTNLLNSYDPHREKRITIGTLVNHAKDGGWKPKSPFETVTPIDANTSRSKYTLLDRDAILALPKLEWRVKHVLPTRGLAALYGPSGSGKTFLVLDLAASICLGEDWFGNKCKPTEVIYIGLEGGTGIQNRVKGWEIARKKQFPSSFKAIIDTFNLLEDECVNELIEQIPKGSVVIIDTLNRATPGIEENSGADMSRVIANAKTIEDSIEGLVLFVHHTGKDQRKGLRGHSSLIAALDAAISIEIKEKKRKIWKTSKVKDGSDETENGFLLKEFPIGEDSDGEEETSCSVEVDPLINKKMEIEPQGSNQKRILKGLKENLILSKYTSVPGLPKDKICIPLQEAVDKTKDLLINTEHAKRSNVAKKTFDSLLDKGFIQGGLDETGNTWLWLPDD